MHTIQAILDRFALKEIVRRSRTEDLKALITRMNFDFDPTLIRKNERAR